MILASILKHFGKLQDLPPPGDGSVAGYGTTGLLWEMASEPHSDACQCNRVAVFFFMLAPLHGFSGLGAR